LLDGQASVIGDDSEIQNYYYVSCTHKWWAVADARYPCFSGNASLGQLSRRPTVTAQEAILIRSHLDDGGQYNNMRSESSDTGHISLGMLGCVASESRSRSYCGHSNVT
jgi:hypothetical protein